MLQDTRLSRLARLPSSQPPKIFSWKAPAKNEFSASDTATLALNPGSSFAALPPSTADAGHGATSTEPSRNNQTVENRTGNDIDILLLTLQRSFVCSASFRAGMRKTGEELSQTK